MKETHITRSHVLCVCGSRTLRWLPPAEKCRLAARVIALLEERDDAHPITAVWHGGSRGGDEIGSIIAAALGVPVRVWRADWAAFGKSAGMIRSSGMVSALPVFAPVVALCDRGLLASPGTAHTVSCARRRGTGGPLIVLEDCGASLPAAVRQPVAPQPVAPLHSVMPCVR